MSKFLLRAVAAVAVSAGVSTAATAAAPARPAPNERLLVEADELVYDNDASTVTLRGNAELHYGPRTLQADSVRYDRATGRVLAQGNVHLTDPTGAVATGDRMELTDDFRDGFIDSLRLSQSTVSKGETVRIRVAAPRAERSGGSRTSFESATYTACEPCRDHPERPPLWQVRSARVVHDGESHVISYEDSTLEVAGIPVGWLPYFETADPTVRRKDGFLAPRYVSSSVLGTGASIPYFVNLAPDYDLTLTPTVLSRQGVLGQAEFRQRLDTGSYDLRLSGIFQAAPSAFLPGPLGAADKDFRGSVESKGRFFINDRWTTGWDLVGVTDKWFLDNYRIRNQSITTDYFREAVSTAYLTGRGDRSWFEARGYYFKALSSDDWQKEQPVVAPVIDYDKRVDGPGRLGGEVRFEANATSLTRSATDFQGVPRTTAYLFSPTVNGTSVPLYGTCAAFERGACIVRGLGGMDTRLTAQASWRRTFTDDLGQAWTPFAYLRADAFVVNPNLAAHQNSLVEGIAHVEDGFTGRAMPAVGIEYRYPFVADMGPLGTHVAEPIAQVVARPSEPRVGRLPNEDAQSLVFDDTTLFEWDKFSGYDRVEGGVRANLGGQYSVTTGSGWYTNLLLGQSFQVAGANSFRRADIAGVGPDSGLERARSDLVGRFQVSPNQNVTLIARARADGSDLGLNRFEGGVSARLAPFAPLSASVFYASYEAQPGLGFSHRREGVTASATYSVTPNWFLSASAQADLTARLEARDAYVAALAAYQASPALPVPSYRDPGTTRLNGLSIGGGYRDECTTVSLTYQVTPVPSATGTRERNQTVLLRVELKTLGEADFRQSVGTVATADGITSAAR